MTGRWNDSSAFRADPDAAPAVQPSRRQTIALLTVLVLVAGAVALASYVIRPEKARAFELFHGSLFLADQKSPVAVDLATGEPTLRLLGADKQVGITGTQPLGVVPLTGRTLLLNEATGEFNMVDTSGFVVKHNGGVPLAKRTGASSSFGVAADNGQAYIVRTGASGGTDVYLVSQPTVESAINATKSVRPRASTSMPEAGSTAPGGTASANGDLWLLVGGSASGGQHTIRQLSVPTNSSAGADLRSTDHGSVDGPAALSTATTGADGSGPTVVGVASADGIQLFAPGADPRTEKFPAPPGVDSILPTTSGQGRLGFLLHGADGWSVVSVAADGSGLQAPKVIDGVPRDAPLAEPAASSDGLYTIDKADGQIYRIGLTGKDEPVAGAASYPLGTLDGRVVEQTDFSDAYAISRGSRVIFNSASHANALMLFTDGSRPPLRIAKSSAVTINAAGGAEALTKSTVNPNQQPSKAPQPGQPKPKPQGAQQVNNKIDCKTAKQKPHIPVITSATPGSRTVALSWNYPVLDNQDCYPSTFLVSVTLISNDAPQPPSSVRVQSQTGTNLSGLFPSTQYAITVTAFINGQGTPSAAVRITTGKEGPAAPSGLAVRADSSGNWIVDWSSCGGVKEGCVPAQTWTVTPSYCDGRGVASPPTPLTETADPTSRKQPTATYKGGDALLGRGLQFQVQGTGDTGQAGTPSAKSACVYSWSPPDTTGVTLAASQPNNVSLGNTATTTVRLDLGTDPVRAVGGIGATITFRLDGPGATRSRSVTYTGRTTDLSTTFPDIQVGAQYEATATIAPPGHDGSAETVGPQPVVGAADWPTDLQVNGDCPSALLSCNLTVSFSGLSSAQANGERFSLTTDSAIVCNSTSAPLQLDGFDPATGTVTENLSQLAGFYGTCTVHAWLVEDGNQPLVFGGKRSPELTTDVPLGKAQDAGAGQGDFAVQWSNRDGRGAYAEIRYTGSMSDDELNRLTKNWSESISAPGGAPCGNDNEQPGSTQTSAAYLGVDSDCVNRYGASTDEWTVTVSYQNVVGGADQGPFNYTLAGPPPGYQPCVPAGFGATWGATEATGVSVTYTGPNNGELDGCDNWTYELQDQTGATCTPVEQGPTGPPPVTIPIQCGTAPAAGWRVVLKWDDTAGDPQTATTTVLGDPPPS